MREDQAELFKDIDNLEYRGFGEQILVGTVALVRLLEQVMFAAGNDKLRMDALDKKIEALSERLDRTNELLHNMINVLDSTN